MVDRTCPIGKRIHGSAADTDHSGLIVFTVADEEFAVAGIDGEFGLR